MIRNAVWASATYDAMHGWRADCARERTKPVFQLDGPRFTRALGDIIQLRYELELLPLLRGLETMQCLLGGLSYDGRRNQGRDGTGTGTPRRARADRRVD